MKVRMLKSAPGSPDGVTINQYDKGREYDVPADLAKAFVAHGLAEKAVTRTKKATAPKENK